MAAQSLIAKLHQPPAYHSVWVRTGVDEATQEFIQDICISVRPQYAKKFPDIPETQDGFKVTKMPWPTGA